MPAGLLDTTTLVSFYKAEKLTVLADVFGDYPPCWCSAVKTELERGPQQQSREILSVDWLTAVAEPTDLTAVFRLRIALAKPGDRKTAHLGEAESIAIAKSHNVIFATDDFAAYDFATKLMNPNKVWDSVRILEEAVKLQILEPEEAAEVVATIRGNGRYLRPTHPDLFTASDFH